MATILSFTPRAPQQPAKGGSALAGSIIMFPGVRYELKEGIDRALAKVKPKDRPEGQKPG